MGKDTLIKKKATHTGRHGWLNEFDSCFCFLPDVVHPEFRLVENGITYKEWEDWING